MRNIPSCRSRRALSRAGHVRGLPAGAVAADAACECSPRAAAFDLARAANVAWLSCTRYPIEFRLRGRGLVPPSRRRVAEALRAIAISARAHPMFTTACHADLGATYRLSSSDGADLPIWLHLSRRRCRTSAYDRSHMIICWTFGCRTRPAPRWRALVRRLLRLAFGLKIITHHWGRWRLLRGRVGPVGTSSAPDLVETVAVRTLKKRRSTIQDVLPDTRSSAPTTPPCAPLVLRLRHVPLPPMPVRPGEGPMSSRDHRHRRPLPVPTGTRADLLSQLGGAAQVILRGRYPLFL